MTILAEKIDPKYNLDAVEGKLFGIGAESYTVGSHEFYLGYAVANKVLLTLDAGHYHPTEVISDKLSAVLTFCRTRCCCTSAEVCAGTAIMWSCSTDELRRIAKELVRGDYLSRVHIGLDYFDASINRVAAWVIGARNMLRALLLALVEPIEQLKKIETAGDTTGRLALLEELKGMPFGAVWDYFCWRQGVPVGMAFMEEIREYEKREMFKRDRN